MEKDKLLPIVAKAKNGDNEALNTLFTETYNDVYYFALKTVKDETLAADVTQETFVTVFQNISTLNDPVAYPAWLRQITYRHCLQYLKKQNREVAVDENEDGLPSLIPLKKRERSSSLRKNSTKTISRRQFLIWSIVFPKNSELSLSCITMTNFLSRKLPRFKVLQKERLSHRQESYEKKHNVKLRCAGVLPLLLWLFALDFDAKSMPAATVQTVATGVTTATGTTLSVSSLVKNGAKVVWSLWQKIVAGLAATAVAIGGTVAVVNVVNKPDDFDLQSEESVVRVWQGQGGINIGLNLSDENEFILEVNQMDEDSIKGRLDVTAVDGTSYSRDFTGTGRPAEMLHAGSTFYDITLDEEIAGWSDDYAGYKEFTLRYQPEEDQFYFDTGPFEAVLKKK